MEDGIDILELRRLLNRKMRFAEREAITKAKSRLYKLIMNMEWRDVEEIENEAQDVKTINDNSPLPALTAGKAAAATAQAATAPAAAQTAKTETPKTAPAKQAPKPAEKPKEAPKPAAAAPAEAPKTAEKPQAAVTGPPKAAIPPDPFAKKEEAAPAEPAPPRKRSERIADLTGVLSCSSGNILAFAAGRLNCVDQNGLNQKKTELDCVLYALEHCAKEFTPSTVGTFVKQEPMSAEFKKKIEDQFLVFFATEMNRIAEANNHG